MNALFTGNPGCGKTTVAKLLARAMAELGFRSQGSLIETSAQEILKLKDPVSDFQTMLEDAKGGTLFIDEAYGFTPAKAGSQPNPSNQVLDYLLQVHMPIVYACISRCAHIQAAGGNLRGGDDYRMLMSLSTGSTSATSR